MCGKYGGPAEMEVFAGYFEVPTPFKNVVETEEFRPMKMVRVLAKNAAGGVVLKDMQWGLIPAHYTGSVKEWIAQFHTFHARLEKIDTTPSFRNAWVKKKRVIFPMERYYEKTTAPADLLGDQRKQHRVAIARTDDKPLGVAGLYDYAHTADGPILSVAMLTREPGPRMKAIHDREPVVLEPETWQAWLDGSDTIDLRSPWSDNAFWVQAA